MEKLTYQNWAGAGNFDWEAWEQRKCDDFNKSRGDLDEYDCPECLNRGCFWELRPGLHRVAVICRCENIRRSIRSCRASGMDRLLQSCTFDNFQVREPWMENMKNTALDWARNSQGWLLLSGQSGCGKTHLAVAACGHRIFRRYQQARFLAWREEMDSLRNMDSGGKQRKTEDWMKTPLLYVDDLLKSAQGRAVAGWEVEMAFSVLNYRYNNQLDTVISTEKTPRELLAIDEALAGRILERSAASRCVITPDRGKNHRLQSAVRHKPEAPNIPS